MRKKIFLYVNYTPDDKTIGITKKINDQIVALRLLDYDVTYSAYTEKGVAIFNNNDQLIKAKDFKSKIGSGFTRRFRLLDLAIDYLDETDNRYEYAYLRWHGFDLKYIKLLKKFKKNDVTTIVEAHAYSPEIKVTNIKSAYTVYIDKFFGKYGSKYVDVFASIGFAGEILNTKTILIDNGININRIKGKDSCSDENINLICVAIERTYHGIDRLLRGLNNYYSRSHNETVILRLVGKYTDKTLDLISKYSLEDYVQVYGKMQGDELDEVYNKSDIGIGALAHHRIGMFSGSSLKSKEYFAKGLPFIYGWDEIGFDGTYKYVHQVDLNEEPININEIIRFYNSISVDDKVRVLEMRNLAENKFSWQTQFEKVFVEGEKN